MSLLTRLTRSRAQLEADESRAVAEAEHTLPINQCANGEKVVVAGTVRSLQLRPVASLPAFEIEVYDGTGSVAVVWIGRRSISGIEAGRRIVVSGRLTCISSGPTIFNPRYELKPVHG